MENLNICVLLDGFLPGSTCQYGAVGFIRRNFMLDSSSEGRLHAAGHRVCFRAPFSKQFFMRRGAPKCMKRISNRGVQSHERERADSATRSLTVAALNDSVFEAVAIPLPF
jgi:hypothetical protein